MRGLRVVQLALLGVFVVTAPRLWADGDAGNGHREAGSLRGLALSGDLGYYTYGMDDVNNRFKAGGSNDIHGGLGYGGAVQFGLSDDLALKLGLDYLQAGRSSVRTIGATTYQTQVDMPATVLFMGVDMIFLPLPIVDLKLLAGATFINIYNGRERTTGSNSFDLGAVQGSGVGFQAGLGAEVFLAPRFSLEGDLAYNYAQLNNVTFAGSPADPGSVNQNGTVDYSGLLAKVAFNIYLSR